ncbi:obscurin-like protein 1 isoform 5-T6 [Morphnus guianensis]
MEGFGGAPRFLAYPRAFTVRSGTDAVLSCQITGEPRPSILWEKDKTPVEPSGRFHVEAKGDLYSLLVSRATPQDSGLYVCKAKNSVGATYAAATLKVEAGEPQEEEGCSGGEAPAFLVAPSSTRVCRGEDVMFTCRVSGQPCPVLEWEKDGHKLSDIFESSHFAMGQEPEDWHFLKLFGARPPDGGVYVCRARSGSREALAAAVLLVEPQVLPDGLPNGSPADGPEPPAERQQRRRQHAAGRRAGPETWVPNGVVPAGVPRAKAFAVSVGKHAKFRCYVTGKPKPEIVWQKDGEPLAPGRRHLIYEDREGYFILKVLYCKPQDQGLYVCTASNTAGQTLSAVQLQVKEHRLRFQVQLTDVEVAEQEDAVLECQVPLETIPTAWYLEDRELQPSHKYVMEEQGVLRRLTIRDARTDDDGIYLCQMKDKGRSIAEVSVRGVIAKRLPRKLDVMEGENAVFCVETQEVVEGTCWSRDGLQLRESPHIVLKSFGRTHLLVLVHVTRQDAGIISFTVGESQTSSQLRVKCVKRDPPSAPVAAEMSVAESNAALLTWCPAPDAHLHPPSRYLLERREAAGGEWVQCLATDLPGRVRVLGDSVPREADYCFRIRAANEHGRSSPVEFPGSVHLAPAARLERGLQDARVRDGEDARFSLELSAAVHGTWILNGARLGEEEEETGGRCSVRRHGTEHSLLIRGVRLADSGAQVTFVSGGVRDSATLHVQGEWGARPEVLPEEQQGLSSWGMLLTPPRCLSAPQVCIAPVPEAERLREVPEGLPVLLECQVSPPGASVCWLKDGEAVPPDDVIALQAEGCVRRLLLRSAGPSDTGVYTCDAGDDAVSFVVTVTEAPVRIVSSNEEAPHAYAAGQRVELWCQLSRPAAPVRWYKDGEEVEAGESLVLEQEGPWRRLVLPCARPQDAGEFVCDARGDSVFYTVTVAEAPVRIVSSNEEAPHAYAAGQRVELWCQLSRPAAPVRWYKDGEEVEAGESLVLEQEGPWRRLVLPCARPQDAGEFVCDAGGDSVFYTVTVAAPQVRIAPVPKAQQLREVLVGLTVLLECQVSPPDAPVRWLKDGEAVVPTEVLAIHSEGCSRRLHIPAAVASDSGMYTCDAGDHAASFRVTVSGELPGGCLSSCGAHLVQQLSPAMCPLAEAPVRIVSSNEEAPHAYVVGQRVELWCQLSHPAAPVRWYKDGEEVEAGESLVLEQEGPWRRLVLPCAQLQDAGEFICDARDASVSYHVSVAEPPVRILHPPQRSLELPVQAPGRVELRCELSVPEAPVRWFKDGLEVDETDNLLLLAEGAWRCLLIPRSSAEDTGEYICESKDEAISFDVKVSEPPVRILQPRRPLPVVTVSPGETVMLGCELSRADAPVRWAKEGVRLEAGGSLVLEEEGAHRRLLIPAARAEHSGKYICDATDDTVTFTVQVLDPPVRILEREVLPTRRHCWAMEDLVLEVHLSHAHREVKWYKDGEKLQDTGRVRLEEDGARRSLVILGATGRDAGEYLCDTGDDSIVFFVTVEVPEPPVTIVGSMGATEHQYLVAGEDLVLAYELSRPDATVRWLRDGQEVQPGERVQVETRGVLRQLTVRGVQPSDSGCYICDAASDRVVMNVEVSAQPVRIVNKEEAQSPLEVLEGDSVTLVARLSPETAAVQWQKDGQTLRSGGRLLVCSEGPVRSLTIKQAELGDGGIFLCDAGDDEVHFTLHVKEAPVLFVNKREEREKLLVLEGGSAVLSAVTSTERADVTWLGPRQAAVAGERCELRRDGRVHSLVLCNVAKEDAGVYTCLSPHDQMQFDVSVRELRVKFLRGLSDVRARQGERAVLWCELCKARGDVVWRKDGRVLVPGPRRQMMAEGRERSLVLSRVEPEDAGEYCCESNDDKTLAMLTVQGELCPRLGRLPGDPCATRAVGKLGMAVAGGVRGRSAALQDGRSPALCPDAPVVVPRVVEIITELQSLTVLEGEDATFKCLVSPEDVAVTWQLNGQPVVPGKRLLVTRSGLCHSLTLQQCQLGDAGTVTANAEGLVSTARLSVQEAQVLFVRKLRDVVAEEQGDVCLEVEVSHEAAEVQWLKQGVLLQPGSKYQLQESGCRRTLTIHCLGPGDRGTYRCESLHDRTQAKLCVEPRKVSIQTPLADVETFEKETATFHLELSHPGVPGVWTRDGIRVKPSSTCRISATGCGHSLTLEGLALEDSGTVTFTADNLRCSARLLVREPPVTMVRVPRDLGVPETGVASFECELSRPSVEVKWFKVSVRPNCLQQRPAASSSPFHPPPGCCRPCWGCRQRNGGQSSGVLPACTPEHALPGQDGQELRPGPNCRIYSAGRRRVLQLSRCELADAGIYTCDAGDCRASATLHVQGTATQPPGGTRTPKPCAIRSPSPLAALAPCPSPTERQVCIVQDLQDAQVREGDNAVFTCEASHGDVKGEWFRDGEKIKVSGTVKIRQEGTRHFLLLCGVRPEDAGLVRFAAGMAVSEASLRVEALPIRIVKPLRDKTVLAQHKATLECTVSHARGRVRWLRGDTEIFAGDKYEICNLDCYRTLIIHRVGPEDEDSYTCDAFDDRSTARLLVEGEGAPRGAPLGAGGGTMPRSRGTPGSLSPCPTACKGLSAGVGGAGCIWDQGSVPTLSGTSLSGAPCRSGNAAALPDFHCPHREVEARMRHSGAARRQTDTTAGRWGHASPRNIWTRRHHPQPALPSGLCIKHFFLTWLLPPQRARVPLGEGVVAPLCIPPSIPGEPRPQDPPSPLPPAQPPAPHTRLRKALYCAAVASAAFGTFTKETEKGDGGVALRGRGRLAETCSSWGSGASRSRLEGAPKAGGAPRSSLATTLPAWPWGSPGSLRNKLIQITAREIYTRREPLPAAALRAGAPALPCPSRRLGPTPGPPPGHYKIQSPAKQRRPLQGSPLP